MKLDNNNQFTMFDYTFTVQDDGLGGQELIIEGMPDAATLLPKGVKFEDIPAAELEKDCRELISLRAQDIQNIIDFMQTGTEKNFSDSVKLKDFFNDALRTEFADEENPMKALRNDVMEFPAFYASGAGVVGPLRNFDDYIYNGKLKTAVDDIYFPEEKRVQIEGYDYPRVGMHLKMESCATGLDTCSYDFIMQDTPSFSNSLYPSFRKDYYFDGKLLASEMERDIGGQKCNKVTIYKNNPLADKYEAYIKNTNMYEISYSYDVIFQQNFKRIAKDFRETYACPALDLGKLNKELPSFEIPLKDGTTKEFTVFDAYDYFKQAKETLLDQHGTKSVHEGIYPFVDEEPIIRYIMEKVKSDYQDYSYSEHIDYMLYVEYENATIPHLQDTLNAPCYAIRSVEADLLKSGEWDVLERSSSELYGEWGAFEKIDDNFYDRVIREKGFKSLSDNLEKAFSDERATVLLNTNVFELNAALVDFNRMIDDYTVNKENKDKVAITLLGTNRGDIDDSIYDYKYFCNEFMPKLVKAAQNKLPVDEKEGMYKTVSEYSKIMTQGKLYFKTSAFKAPCEKFCEQVVEQMSKDDGLNDYIKYGKTKSVDRNNHR